jgi:hypothetical protein
VKPTVGIEPESRAIIPVSPTSPIQPDALYGFALLGARASSFHHDLAAKLQGLMMALDEISDELEGGRHPELQEASTTARAALEELTTLLASNRALARSARSEIGLREAIAAASARANVVVRGEIPDVELHVVAPAFIQALAMLFASTGKNRRGSGGALDVRVADGELSFAAGPEGAAGTELAIAAWALARDGGELRVGAQLVIKLPSG